MIRIPDESGFIANPRRSDFRPVWCRGTMKRYIMYFLNLRQHSDESRNRRRVRQQKSHQHVVGSLFGVVGRTQARGLSTGMFIKGSSLMSGRSCPQILLAQRFSGQAVAVNGASRWAVPAATRCESSITTQTNPRFAVRKNCSSEVTSRNCFPVTSSPS